MREILFRGKSKDNGEWVQGFYVCAGGKLHYILIGKIHIVYGNVEFVKCIVDPSAIGQYTGLKDKRGQRIFEGDLVQAVLPKTTAQMGFTWPIMPVVFRDGTFGLLDHRDEVTPFRSFAPRVTFEVLGNIHDNPELMKGE